MELEPRIQMGKAFSEYSKPDSIQDLGSQRLDRFRFEFCPDVTPVQMKGHIQKGKELQAKLFTLTERFPCSEDGELKLAAWEKTIQNEDPPIATSEDVVGFMWLMMSQAAGRGDGDYGDLYTNGAMKLAGGEIDGKMMEAVFKSVDGAYSRISSHMKENLKADDVQWGIDLRDAGLPASKQHLLFAAQPDGSLFLKMELYGCPPFWKKEFRSLKNFNEFVGHALTFVTTRPFVAKGLENLHLSSTVKEMKAKRKEHLPNDLKSEYLNLTEMLFPKEKSSFFEKIKVQMGFSEKKTDNRQEREEFKAAFGKGIDAMQKKVKERLDAQSDGHIYEGKIVITLRHLDKQRQKVLGNEEILNVSVKGNEVILPPLKRE